MNYIDNINNINQKKYHLPLFIVLGLFILFLLLPLFTPSGVLNIFSKTWTMALYAISLDLIFGYTGLVSLGHATFFAIGAYAAAILMRMNDITSFWVVTPAAGIAGAVLAAVLGLIALRTKGTYFMLITLAFSGMLYSATTKWKDIFGGSDGIAAIPAPDFGFFDFKPTTINLYYLTFIIFAIGYLLIFLITKTAFGKALLGIKENETRMKVSGYNTWLYKYVAFIIAGGFAGIAGASFVYFNSFVAPYVSSISQSANALLMIIIGGPATLYGGVIGAAVITFVGYYASLIIATRWPLIVGFIFVAVIMWLRGGIAPYIQKLLNYMRTRHGSIES